MVIALNQFFCLHRKNLVMNLVARNFKVKFRGSVLGYLWTLVIPLSQVCVFYFVYQLVLKVPIPNYLAFIVTGIMPWVFFTSTVNESLEGLVSGQHLLSHVPMPVQAFPAATVLTNFLSFTLSMPVILGVLLWSGLPLSWSMLFALPLLGALVLFTYCLSFILACFYVLFRDLKYIFGIFVNLWMYGTPVLYSIDMVPENFKWIFFVNPLTGFFVGFREVLLSQPISNPTLVAAFFAWTLAMFVAANVVRATISLRLVERL
jgi:ABC-type polysaccharide/polyol phosphate export permease